jgi:hypothetical protein
MVDRPAVCELGRRLWIAQSFRYCQSVKTDRAVRAMQSVTALPIWEKYLAPVQQSSAGDISGSTGKHNAIRSLTVVNKPN